MDTISNNVERNSTNSERADLEYEKWKERYGYDWHGVRDTDSDSSVMQRSSRTKSTSTLDGV